MISRSGQVIAARGYLAVLCCCGLLLTGCEDRNKYQPPPAPEVGVLKPQLKRVTLYLELTGNTSAFNKVDLMARVQGFLEKVGYKDGQTVAAGATLFVIEQLPYETNLQIAEATVKQQQALLVQYDADLKRQLDLQQRQVASEAKLDDSRAKRDSTFAALEQAKGQVEQAKINLGYTEIKAPFTGIVTARLVDPGALVGAGGPTKLATIVQIEPIYVNFSVNEQQVLQIREQLRSQGVTLKDLGPIPVEVGLQTETGFPHTGRIDYIAPDLDQSTGTLSVRGLLDNKDAVLLPGLFVRVRVPTQRDVESLLVPDRALGNGQQGRYVLVVNDKNIVEQRPVETGDVVDGGLRIIKSGLKPEDRVVVTGIQRAVPGNAVKPVEAAPTAAPDTAPRAPAPAAPAARKDKP
jgi:membrane fusion protein, multidrug efflux system